MYVHVKSTECNLNEALKVTYMFNYHKTVANELI
jgi:hypothetical protein